MDNFEYYLNLKNWKDNSITRFLFKRNMSPAEFCRITGFSQSNLSNICRKSEKDFSTTALAFVRLLEILHKLDLDYVLKEIK